MRDIFGNWKEHRILVHTAPSPGIVRQAAKRFGISKSTVHKDATERLEEFNPDMAAQVRSILDVNKQERHIRGGMATRKKYLNMHEQEK